MSEVETRNRFGKFDYQWSLTELPPVDPSQGPVVSEASIFAAVESVPDLFSDFVLVELDRAYVVEFVGQ